MTIGGSGSAVRFELQALVVPAIPNDPEVGALVFCEADHGEAIAHERVSARLSRISIPWAARGFRDGHLAGSDQVRGSGRKRVLVKGGCMAYRPRSTC